jgi:hypothetical protein
MALVFRANRTTLSSFSTFYFNLFTKNSGRQCHFKVWLDCHKLKKCPCLIMPMSTKCQGNEKKMTTNVIEHDDRL